MATESSNGKPTGIVSYRRAVVDGKTYLEEQSNGTWDVVHHYNLSTDGLINLAAACRIVATEAMQREREKATRMTPSETP